MRAAILRELGATPALGDWDEPPAPGDGQALARVAEAWERQAASPGTKLAITPT